MPEENHKPLSNMQVSVRPFSALQLSELAKHYGQTLEEAAIIAIHMAYLQHLEEKREWAMRTLDLYLGQPDFDDKSLSKEVIET